MIYQDCSPEELKLYRHTERLLRQINLYDKTIDCDSAKVLLSQCDNKPRNTLPDEFSFAYQEFEYLRKEKVVQAEILASKLYDTMLHKVGEGEFRVLRPFEYLAINPHNFRIKCAVYLPTDSWECGQVIFGKFYIKDDKNKRYPAQRIETIRGALIAINVVLEPREKKAFTLNNMSFVNPRNICKSIKSLYLNASKRTKTQSDMIDKFKIMRITENSEGKTTEIAKITKISNCYSGEVCRKIGVTYSLKGNDTIRYINGYYTFFRDSNKVEISIDISKSNSLVPESFYLQIVDRNGDILIDNKEKLINTNGSRHYIEKCLVLNNVDSLQVFTVLDNNKICFIDDLPCIELITNCADGKLKLNNACMLESRFVIEDCDIKNINNTMLQHDIDAITVRR